MESKLPDLLSFFPGTPRPIQVDVLKEVQKAIDTGYKYIIINAPTGTGKSYIATTIARSQETSAILTSTKDLQEQYADDFRFMYTVKGKQNFQCLQLLERQKHASSYERKHLTCEKGRCFDPELEEGKRWCKYHPNPRDFTVKHKNTLSESVVYEGEEEKCHYFLQKYKGLAASHTIFNYAAYLSLLLYSNEPPERKVVVCDEAHELEHHAVSFFGIEVRKAWADLVNVEFPDYGKDLSKWIRYLQLLVNEYNEFYQECDAAVRDKQETEVYNSSNLSKAESRIKTMSLVLEETSKNINNYCVANIQRENGRPRQVVMQPIDIAPQVAELFKHSDLYIFMSATIENDVFCKTAGIEPEKCAFIEIKHSPFPRENRIVNFLNIAYLNKDTPSTDITKIINTVDQLMTKHCNEKGLILTTSYQQLYQIRQGLSFDNSRRLIETGNGEDSREEIIKAHKRSTEPTVLLSPSLWNGVDLKDDTSRFQIIVKTPYLDLGDGRILAKRNRDEQWYGVQSVMKLIQGCGRSVRHENDYAVTYVLDANALSLIKRMWNSVPAWFREVIRE